jgi:hypothetical protein
VTLVNGCLPLLLNNPLLIAPERAGEKLVCNNATYSMVKACTVMYLELILYKYNLLRSCETMVVSGGDPTDPWVVPFEVHLRSSGLCSDD